MTAPPANPHRAPRWLLPAELAGLSIDEPRRRRTVRDWIADTVLFLAAALVVVVESGGGQYYGASIPQWMHAVDPFLAVASCLVLWWRRRFPLVVAGIVLVAYLFSDGAIGAALIAVLTVAIHRGWLAAFLVVVAFLTPSLVFIAENPPPELPWQAMAVIIVLMFLVPLGWGMAVRFRRQVVASLRRDAEWAARDHERRLDAARRAERERIAREMHDTLAHRISLISVHAGALAYRSAQAEAGAGRPLDAGDVGAAIDVIHGNARRALVELGDVLEVLRTDAGDGEPGAPQPGIGDLARLVADAEAVGQRVAVTIECVPTETLRAAVQRTVYRTVQEGLTNARKHAPGAKVEVTVTGAPGAGVVASVCNPLPAGTPPVSTIPGAGVGLAGLAERVALDGGTLEHGPAGGCFRLVTRLPWPA
ncbi:signal transduction histidine kinase [Asanoa ferruginea]|uniref:histidine kinase n=1 Tax=Asanoa ferruginea TaxID=53367 RepID=A0A3D9ZC63_9ACTN|nr:histidine kinase [Asanoa ferruginea]REF94901.1 signal transduction histidine kinase [Asanoa ferruginea]GIF45519.1 two-component sensor histidine kinase [Asanoa ferruginea]